MLRFRTSLVVTGLACGVSLASAQTAPAPEAAKPAKAATSADATPPSAAPKAAAAPKQTKAKKAKAPATTTSAAANAPAATPAATSGKSATPAPAPAATTVATAGQTKAPPTAARVAAPAPSGPKCKIEEPEQPRGGRLEVTGSGFGQTPLVRVAGKPLRMIERREDRLSVQIPADSDGGPVVVQADGRSEPCGRLVIIGKNR
ncbi:MAG TPA: hypothetical protein VJV78_22285 [Polyangiales bacterium]|nr:hypothetical protein [Polyangiales bacterium]